MKKALFWSAKKNPQKNIKILNFVDFKERLRRFFSNIKRRNLVFLLYCQKT